MATIRGTAKDFADKAYHDEGVRELKLTHKEVNAVVRALKSAILETLLEERDINLFNLFYVKIVQKKGYVTEDVNNPGHKRFMPPHNRLYFSATRPVREKIKELELVEDKG